MSGEVETEQETEQRLANIFKRLDRKENGRIDIQDLSAALKDFGMSVQYAEVIAQNDCCIHAKIKSCTQNGVVYSRCLFSFVLFSPEISQRIGSK